MKQKVLVGLGIAAVCFLRPAAGYAVEGAYEGLYYTVIDGEAYVTAEKENVEYCFPTDIDELTFPASVILDGAEYPVAGFYSYGREIDITPELFNLPETVNFSATMTKYVRDTYYSHGTEHTVEPLLEYLVGTADVQTKSKYINFAEGNPLYSSYDGIVYNAAGTVPVLIPAGRTETITVSPKCSAIPENFAKNSKFTEIILPQSVRVINQRAFAGSKITSIDIPGSVAKIDKYAFEDCTDLRSVTFHEGTSFLNHYAFDGCTGLTSIALPASAQYVYCSTFNGCTGVTEFTVASGNQSLQSDNGCVYTIGLEKLMIAPFKTATYTAPAATREIGDDVFNGNTWLRSATLGENVEKIGERAFKDCSKLTDIILPQSVKSIGRDAFAMFMYQGESAPNRNIELSDNLTTLAPEVFYGNRIASFKWSAALESIGEMAFYNTLWPENCDIVMPSGVTEIGDNAFGYTYSFAEENNLPLRINSLTLPGSLRSMGKNAMALFRPDEMYCGVWTPPVCDGGPFVREVYANTRLYVPEGSELTYMETSPWSEFIYINPYHYSGVGDIADDADMSIVARGGVLSISVATPCAIAVYAADGRQVYTGTGSCELTPGRGIYIVRAGNRTCKVML